MTNLEKLKAWQEEQIANGAENVNLVDAAIEEMVGVSDEDIEKAAGILLEILEWG